jgi:hypothetical protein
VKVWTKNGPVEQEDLRLEVKHQFEGVCLTIACEWFDGAGELVRRDCWANGLMPLEAGVAQGSF